MFDSKQSVRKVTSALLLTVTLSVGHATAQSELDQLADRVEAVFKAEKPSWKCERGKGSFGAQDTVLIESCHSSNLVVGISIQRHDSVQDAQQEMRKLFSGGRHRQQMPDLGDEALGWGMDSADIVLRKNKFTVSINIVADIDGYVGTDAERWALAKADRLRLPPEFARHVLNGIGP